MIHDMEECRLHFLRQSKSLLNRDVVGTDETTEAVVEPPGLGARHSGRFAVLAMDIDDNDVDTIHDKSSLVGALEFDLTRTDTEEALVQPVLAPVMVLAPEVPATVPSVAISDTESLAEAEGSAVGEGDIGHIDAELDPDPLVEAFSPVPAAMRIGLQQLDDIDVRTIFARRRAVMKTVPKFLWESFRVVLKVVLEEISA